MKTDVILYLQTIQESVERVQEFTLGIEEQEFLSNRMMQDAVLWNFDRIGNAAREIDNDFRRQHRHLPWGKVENMRTRAGLESELDMLTIWATVVEYIPVINREVKKLLVAVAV